MKLPLRLAALPLLGALLLSGCTRQGVPSAIPKDENGEGTLPFNQSKREGGISPTSSLLPGPAKLPAGTAVTIRLKSSVSSATAHVGDSFEAVLDQPITVQGKAVFPAGTPVLGTVVALKRMASPGSPAYLRVKVTSINGQGKIAVESSSIFGKAGLPRVPRQPDESEVGEGSGSSSATQGKTHVRFAAGQRLTFRLTAPTAVPE